MTYPELVATANTKLLYHLNGDSTDSSGNGNNGSDSNITYGLANGLFGQGALFNGVNSSISKSSAASLNFGTSITISCWLYMDSTQQSYGNILCKRASGTNIDWQLMLAHDAGYGANRYKMFIQYYNGGVLMSYSNFLYNAYYNQWINVIVTISGGTVKFYLNGVSDGSSTTQASIISSNQALYLGTENGAANTRYKGKMDELAVENRIWTATEVSNYYNMAKGAFIPKVI